MPEPTTVEPATAPAEPTTEPKPTETVEFWKQKAREQEKRAKDNADAAKRLAEIEESQKSEADKAAERLRKLEDEAATARRDALRFKVAAKFRIDDEDAELFLTGADEDTLTKQAQRLAGRAEERKKSGNVVPTEGSITTPPADQVRDFTRKLFGRDD